MYTNENASILKYTKKCKSNNILIYEINHENPSCLIVGTSSILYPENGSNSAITIFLIYAVNTKAAACMPGES